MLKYLVAVCTTVCLSLPLPAEDHGSVRLRPGGPALGGSVPTVVTALAPAGPRATIYVRYLGYTCSHCVEQLAYLNTYADALRMNGIAVVAFSDDDARTNAALVQQKNLRPDVITIVSDVQNSAAKAIDAIQENGPIARDLHATIVAVDGKVVFSALTDEPYMDVERLVAEAVKGQKGPAKPMGLVALDELPPSPLTKTLASYVPATTTVRIVAGPNDGIREPRDLDFATSVLNPRDLWVVNTDEVGHSMSIIHEAGRSTQNITNRKDAAASHFMWRTTGIAFSDVGTFATSQRGEPGNGDREYLFMGPTLWSSDTAIFAARYQDNNQYLASHLDMLHQSPYGLGIAHDRDNVFWVVDNRYKDVTRYDYQDPHEVGGTDHRDGIVRRYADVSISPAPLDRDAHAVMDRETAWLYFVDPGANRVMRLNTRSGNPVEALEPPPPSMEYLTEFTKVTGAAVETVIASGIGEPVGIEIVGRYLLVGDRSSGKVFRFRINNDNSVTKVDEFTTNATSLSGIVVGPDGKIWFADRGASTVGVLEPAGADDLRAQRDVIPVWRRDTVQATLTYTNNGTTARSYTITLDVPGEWNAQLTESTITLDAGASATIVINVSGDTNAAPSHITARVSPSDDATTGLTASMLLFKKDGRRFVVEDAPMEVTSISETISSTGRDGYVFVSSDNFRRIVDSLPDLATVVWNVGSFGDIDLVDDAIMQSMQRREVEILAVGDDPFFLRTDLPLAPRFFGMFGVSILGPQRKSPENGQRILRGTSGDPIGDGLDIIDCQLPRLDHYRGGLVVPNMTFESASSSAFVSISTDNNRAALVRYEANAETRSAIFGINAARFTDGNQRATIYDRTLEWLEATSKAPTEDPDTTTSVHNTNAVASHLSVAGQMPFTERTVVRYTTTSDDNITIALYASNGQRVTTLYNGPVHETFDVSIDGTKLAVGTYFVIATSATRTDHVTIIRN